MIGAQAGWLPDGRRLHLHHGPIDLVIDAAGPDRDAALARAAARFEGLLEELVAELPALRQPVTWDRRFDGTVARRMAQAACAHLPEFVTPMAAVAGSVADEMLAAMCVGLRLDRAYVNNGGDIAFHLAPGERFTAMGPAGEIALDAHQPARGLATSGWRGRSHSLGIADAVTVAAETAAEADVAATLIANAVDLPGHPAITRRPACELAPDSDLGNRLVTVDVGPLAPSETAAALSVGLARARAMQARGLICAAVLSLAGQTRVVAAQQQLEEVE